MFCISAAVANGRIWTRGAFASIESIDLKRNSLKLRSAEGIQIETEPGALARHRSFIAGKHRTLAVGDRLQFRAQGATVDRVIVNGGSIRSAQLINRKQFYVSWLRRSE
jgi:hypothetical protein